MRFWGSLHPFLCNRFDSWRFDRHGKATTRNLVLGSFSLSAHASRCDPRRLAWWAWSNSRRVPELEAAAKGPDGARALEPNAKSVIHIYLQGGFPHMDSFDPKPDAPAEYRGILDAIETKLSGVRFSSHLKKTAQIADKLTIVRSMSHTEVDHSRGQHSMFTGYRPSPALTYPSIGSVTANEYGPRADMPPYICLPNQGSEFLGSGYLSNAFGRFALGADPARPSFSVRDLSSPKGVDEARFSRSSRVERPRE